VKGSNGNATSHRITLISGQLDIGGQERALYLLVRGLDRRFQSDVVSLAEGGFWAREIEKLGIPVLTLPRRRSWDLGRLFRLVRHLRQRRPALVYSLGFAANTYGRIAGLCARVPRMVTGWRGLEASPRRRLIELLLARSTDRVVCNSKAVIDDVLSHYPIPPERAVLIVNGVDPVDVAPDERARARAEWAAGPATLVVGSVARLSEDKNPMLFLATAARVQAIRPDILFVLVGGGPLGGRVEASAVAQGLKNLRLLGERSDARRLYPGFDVFILTSHREGMPNAVLEAMAAGIPCVATSVGGSREVVLDGTTGFLVRPGDAEGLSARILELAASSDLRKNLGSAGSARARREYSPEKMVREHEALFDEVISGSES
jgi:glycosyltransferase involved in cell wall biosynthesis